MVIEWTPALAVGVPEIDGPLAEVFRSAARVAEALRAGRLAVALRLAACLDDRAARHFAAEERLMRRTGYPGLVRHAAAHESFRAGWRARTAALERTGATAAAALAVHNWLSDWLRGHVGGEDRDLARFLASRAT